MKIHNYLAHYKIRKKKRTNKVWTKVKEIEEGLHRGPNKKKSSVTGKVPMHIAVKQGAAGTRSFMTWDVNHKKVVCTVLTEFPPSNTTLGSFINRLGIAGAVLQTPLSLSNSLSQSAFSSKSSKYHNSRVLYT